MLIDAARFAAWAHGSQQYAGRAYSYHLDQVEGILAEFGFTHWVWRARAQLHDVIEDTFKWLPPKVRLFLLTLLFGRWVTGAVWRVSGIGPNRKARNTDIYRKIDGDMDGCILKCADRTANVEASLKDPATGEPNLPMINMYLGERGSFTGIVKPMVPAVMWARLERAFDACQEIVDRGKRSG